MITCRQIVESGVVDIEAGGWRIDGRLVSAPDDLPWHVDMTEEELRGVDIAEDTIVEIIVARHMGKDWQRMLAKRDRLLRLAMSPEAYCRAWVDVFRSMPSLEMEVGSERKDRR